MLVVLCHLEFLDVVQRAKADDTTRAPGATRQIGSREERETLGRGKQLDIWRLSAASLQCVIGVDNF